MMNENIDIRVILTASSIVEKYGDIRKKVGDDGFKIHTICSNLVDTNTNQDMARTVALSIMDLTQIFMNDRPDAVITIADRYETIATSISSSYMNIPLIHIQGGEVTGNIDEKVRHANTKLADIHIVSNEDAKTRLVKMGEDKNKIFNTGCPSIDLAMKATNKYNIKNLQKKINESGIGDSINIYEDYIIVLYHPVTYHSKLKHPNVSVIINAIEKIKTQVIWFWPNSDQGSDIVSKSLRVYFNNKKINKFKMIKNIDGENFVRLLDNCKCLVGNSSAGIRECSSLGVPVVNIGDRQEGRVRAENVVDVKLDEQEIINAINKQIKNGKYNKSNLFGDGNASKRISEVIRNVELTTEKKIAY